MKKILFIVFSLLVFHITASANSIHESGKTTVFPIYINNAKTAFDKDLEQKLVKSIEPVLSKNYAIVKNDNYKEDFKKIGIEDLSKAERVDILEVFKDKTDFVVILEIEPVINESSSSLLSKSVTSKGSLQLKIVDIINKKYLVNERISYKDKDSQLSVSYLDLIDIKKKPITMRNFEKILKQASNKIVTTIPKTNIEKTINDKTESSGNILMPSKKN